MDLARRCPSGPVFEPARSRRGTTSDRSSAFDHCAGVEVHSDLASVAPLWHGLEATGTSGPYQTLAWFTAWMDEAAGARRESALVIVARDERGVPTFLLPLVVRAEPGWTAARFAGGRHANFNTPVLAAGVEIGPSDVDRALSAVARLRPDIDLFVLDALPTSLGGASNPLVGPGSRPHTAQGSVIALATVGEPAKSSKRLREERRCDRGLRRLGTVEIRVAAERSEIQRALSTFTAQKVRWFATRGIPNPFEEEGVVAFLGSLSRDPRSGFALHMLTLDGAVVAVTGTLKARERASLMLVSYDATSPAAAFGPGLRLIRAVMEEVRGEGCLEFDLGLGEATYKARLSAQAMPVSVLIKPVSIRGRVAAAIVDLGRRSKILAKRHPRLVRVLQRLRTGYPVRRPDVVP